MPASDQLTELKRAYQALGLPLDASAHSIKQAYRRLLKRWHPDLYQSGTSVHAEATQMTQLINEAYSAIAHAPLRYHVESYQAHMRGAQTRSASANESSGTSGEEIPNTDRIEFWVRFACGAFVGVFAVVDLFLSIMPDSVEHPVIAGLAALGIVVAFGLGAARYGDKFWYAIFRRWWLWP